MLPIYFYSYEHMNKTELKSLVKEYFNLVDAPAKETFGEIATADGSVTLMFPGEEIEIGTPLTIVDAEGNTIPAPAGEHLLADGQRVVLDEEGKVTEFLMEEPAEDAEATEEALMEHGDEEDHMMDHGDDEEEMMEEGHEMLPEEVEMEEAEAIIEEIVEEVAMDEHYEEEAPMMDAKEIIEAVTEAVMEEMRKEIEAMKAEMTKEVSAFKKAPAAKKTLPTRRQEEIASKVEMNVFNKARWEQVQKRFKK